MKQEIILLSENAIVPKKGTVYSACWDLFSPGDYLVPAHGQVFIKTDVSISWDDPEYYMQIFPRSGLALKNGITCHPGVVDFDYRQNVGIILRNFSGTDFQVKMHDRIAQYTFIKIVDAPIQEVQEFTLDVKSDRNGGFGSTGLSCVDTCSNDVCFNEMSSENSS